MLNSPALHWQQIPSPHVLVYSDVYAPSAIDVRSLRHNTVLGAEAARGLASDQSTSAIPESPAHFREKVILLDFDHNAVMETSPASVLQLTVDWPAIKVPALSCRVQRFRGKVILLDFDPNAVLETGLPQGAEAAGGRASDESAGAIPESPTHFRREVILIDFNHNAVLETAPPSVLKLPGTETAGGLASDQSTSAFLESPAFPRKSYPT
jgi:hypothetical protein